MRSMGLADYLRSAREKAGMTQIEVATKLGYSTSQFVSNWERGRSAPPMNALRPLSKMYKVSMDHLFEHIFNASMHMAAESLRKQYLKIKKHK